ncbi:aldo/keto reductase family oxidoreductase [Neorhizobium galegae]|uniref:aldo/keto reductase n=1 Tax=Neorhizobium galegae TaxID=399 RepID=UPI000627DFBD|nr:aldo/keto reductase [Neorhizobium galegae]KAA9389066.1 oxidoreductase [Neorhizobium galegae]KAB1114116.1 oxidoreductase [Neorhizobium galegae]MCM2497013.1 aldo/keto reductase [Neorhizobium galegae]MCQ1771081.1 aldo/keto reductase [Neorhizobium galegae]MCQ1780056.1 aldo/keto reductase [Neorhizobium galegae]
MDRIQLSPDLQLSRLVYGMWRIGDDADTSPKHVQAKIEACLAQGITTMDQADIYGGYTAEAIFGAALKASPSLRDKIEIVTKCGIVAPAARHSAVRGKHYDTSAAHINASVEASLRDMATDYIDLLLIHRPDPFMDPDETGPALDALVVSGKVRAVGVSNFRPWDFSLLQSSMEAELVTNQIEVSLVATSAFTNGDLAYLQERAIAPMAWSPLGGGSLFRNESLMSVLERIAAEQDVEATAVAVAWLLAHPAAILPVLGTNNLARIATIADAAKVTIDRQTWFELYTAAIGKQVP